MTESSTELSEAQGRRQLLVNQINRAYQQSIDNIFQIGHWLIELQQKVGHGQFKVAFDNNELDFGMSVAFRFMAVARDEERLLAHVQHLPLSYATLYQLARLSDEELAAAVERGWLRPEMERWEVEAVRGGAELPEEIEFPEPGAEPDPEFEAKMKTWREAQRRDASRREPRLASPSSAPVVEPWPAAERLPPAGVNPMSESEANFDDDAESELPIQPWEASEPTLSGQQLERLIERLDLAGIRARFERLFQPSYLDAEGEPVWLLEDVIRVADPALSLKRTLRQLEELEIQLQAQRQRRHSEPSE